MREREREMITYFNLCPWSESWDRINTDKIYGTRSAHTICDWDDMTNSKNQYISSVKIMNFISTTVHIEYGQHITWILTKQHRPRENILLSSAISPWSGWQTIKFSTSTPNALEYAGSKACSASTSIAFPPSFCVFSLKRYMLVSLQSTF